MHFCPRHSPVFTKHMKFPYFSRFLCGVCMLLLCSQSLSITVHCTICKYKNLFDFSSLGFSLLIEWQTVAHARYVKFNINASGHKKRIRNQNVQRGWLKLAELNVAFFSVPLERWIDYGQSTQSEAKPVHRSSLVLKLIASLVHAFSLALHGGIKRCVEAARSADWGLMQPMHWSTQHCWTRGTKNKAIKFK